MRGYSYFLLLTSYNHCVRKEKTQTGYLGFLGFIEIIICAQVEVVGLTFYFVIIQ